MRPPHFDLRPHNSHYTGAFDSDAIAWLAAGARDKARNIVTLLAEEARGVGSVLEVGCGTGAVLLELQRIGVGREHRGIDQANPDEHTDPAAAAADLTLESYDGKRLPFADASFDLVYATHVLEHVAEEQPFLAELRRVARRFVYVEVPCELTLRSNVARLQSTLDIGHLHPYTADSFALELCRAGLAPDAFQLFDSSLEIHLWNSGQLKGRGKMALRRGLLALSPHWASKLFCYHAGALCRVDVLSSTPPRAAGS